jgi:hypothetical protein
MVKRVANGSYLPLLFVAQKDNVQVLRLAEEALKDFPDLVQEPGVKDAEGSQAQQHGFLVVQDRSNQIGSSKAWPLLKQPA